MNVWWNGRQVVRYSGPVGYNDDFGPYFKFGLYRDDSAKTYVVYFNHVRLGDRREDVDFFHYASRGVPAHRHRSPLRLCSHSDDLHDNRPAVLTPPPATPHINGPTVFGVRPGSPFLYTIPTVGDRPMNFSVENLPKGLAVDPKLGADHGFPGNNRGISGRAAREERPWERHKELSDRRRRNHRAYPRDGLE